MRYAAFCNGSRERARLKNSPGEFSLRKKAKERVADITRRDLTESGRIKRAYFSYVPPRSDPSTRGAILRAVKAREIEPYSHFISLPTF